MQNMGKAYLLTGEKKAGKTTALKKIIDAVGAGRCDGFYAEEIRHDGLRTGFQIVTLNGEKGVLADIKSRSSIRVGRLNQEGIGKYGVDLEFLEGFAIQTLYSAVSRKDIQYLIIDEIGPMQLYSDKFKQAVNNVMDSQKILIGTIVFPSHPWADQFKERKEVETFLLTLNNRVDMTKMLTWFFGQL
jgi:nucleoside-triphosphatase